MKKVPAYFESLTLENIKCFEEKQTLRFGKEDGHPFQWTIIVGDNGIGKTTILQCLALSEPLHTDQIVLPIGASRFLDLPLLRYSKKEGNFCPKIRLRKENVFSSKNGTDKDIFEFQLIQRESRVPERLGVPTFKREKVPELLCYGYGATRRMGNSNFGGQEIGHFDGLFFDGVALGNPEEWLLKAQFFLYQKEINAPIEKKRFEQFKRNLIQLLPYVSEIYFPKQEDMFSTPRVEFQTPHGRVKIEELSLGYRTLISWMVDLAGRMFERYKESEDPLAEPAVVLIDEIDLHLHPKWQREVMESLSETFKNTQFIVTAHSPLILQARSDANIVLLKNEKGSVKIVQDLHSVRGWRVDQILTSDFFGLSSSHSKRTEDLLTQRRAILSKSRLTKKDKETLQSLESEIGPLPVGETKEEIQMMDFLRKATDLLKAEDKKR